MSETTSTLHTYSAYVRFVYLSIVGETSSGCGWVSWNLIQFFIGYI